MSIPEHCYGPFMTIRPVPEPGTRVSFISGPWKGHSGVYVGKDRGLHAVKPDNAGVAGNILFIDPRCLQLEANA